MASQLEKGPRLYFVWKLGKFDQIRKVGMRYQETQESSFGKFGKFIGKMRKEIWSLGKFVWKNEVVRKVRPPYQESWRRDLKKKSPHLILVGKLGKLGPIRKIHWVNQEILSENYAKLGKNLQNQEKKLRNQEIFAELGKFIRKVRKNVENQEN